MLWSTSSCGNGSHSWDFVVSNKLLHVFLHSEIFYYGIMSYEKTAAEDGPCASHLAQHPDINDSFGLSCYKI